MKQAAHSSGMGLCGLPRAPHHTKASAALQGPASPGGPRAGAATSLHCDFPSKIVWCFTKSPKHNSVTQQFGSAGYQASPVKVLLLVTERGAIPVPPRLTACGEGVPCRGCRGAAGCPRQMYQLVGDDEIKGCARKHV